MLAAFGSYSAANLLMISPRSTHSATRRHDAGVKARNVEHAVQKAMQAIDRRPHHPGDLDGFRLAGDLPLDHRQQQHQRLHGLAQIVAGRGEELGLGLVGAFGLGLGDGERAGSFDLRRDVAKRGRGIAPERRDQIAEMSFDAIGVIIENIFLRSPALDDPPVLFRSGRREALAPGDRFAQQPSFHPLRRAETNCAAIGLT